VDVLQLVVESFIRLVRSEIHPETVLMAADDVFEVTATPSVVLQGPTLTEDTARRTQSCLVVPDKAALTYEECRQPRLYHLDFDIIITTAKQQELLELIEKMARFHQLHTVIPVGEYGALNLTEATPLGSLKRVNLSNLRQASGRCRIEDCPVYDGLVRSGKLIAVVDTQTFMENTN